MEVDSASSTHLFFVIESARHFGSLPPKDLWNFLRFDPPSGRSTMELDTSKLLRLQKMSRVLPWIPNITKASKRELSWHLLWWSSRFLHVFVVNLPVKTDRRLQCLNNHATHVEQCWLKCAHRNFEVASAERTGISNEWFMVHGPEDGQLRCAFKT